MPLNFFRVASKSENSPFDTVPDSQPYIPQNRNPEIVIHKTNESNEKNDKIEEDIILNDSDYSNDIYEDEIGDDVSEFSETSMGHSPMSDTLNQQFSDKKNSKEFNSLSISIDETHKSSPNSKSNKKSSSNSKSIVPIGHYSKPGEKKLSSSYDASIDSHLKEEKANLKKRRKMTVLQPVGHLGLDTFTFNMLSNEMISIEQELLSGEEIRDSAQNLYLNYDDIWPIGNLYVTNYRMIFKPAVLSSYDDVPRINNSDEYCSVPLCSIYKVEKIGEGKQDNTIRLDIWTKDMKHLKLSFKSPNRQDSTLNNNDLALLITRKRIAKILREEIEIPNFFAYKFEYPPITLKSIIDWENSLIEAENDTEILKVDVQSNEELDLDSKFDGWELYNPYTEFGIRQGILCDMESRHKKSLCQQELIKNRILYGKEPPPYQKRECINPIQKWRTCNLNKNYEISESYPKIFCVPDMMTDEEVKAVATFRSKGRIPVLCWCDPNGGASITRASQPLVGMVPIKRKGKLQDDQRMIELIISTNPTVKSLMIVDLRPKINADANKLFKGAGYEKNYINCEIKFMNIDNIHAMRSSMIKVLELCINSGGSDSLFYLNLENSKWLDHIRVTLRAALFCVMCIEGEGKSILVHCSDGWDRTSQVTSLTMLMLDPYYRTMEGFCLLIEKEWCSFGHQFHKRIGPGSKNYFQEERSPIFLLFFECIYQLMHQHPTSFEFNDKFLLLILDELFACRFGTFLFDSERERTIDPKLDVTKKTPSLWTYALSPIYRQNYVNPLYDPSEKTTSRSISPDLRKSHIKLWNEFWVRYLVPSNTLIFPHRSHSLFNRSYAYFQAFPIPRDVISERSNSINELLKILKNEKKKVEQINESSIILFQNEFKALCRTVEIMEEEKNQLKIRYEHDTDVLLRICDEQRQELRKWRQGSIDNLNENIRNLILLENEASVFMNNNDSNSEENKLNSITQQIKELYESRTNSIYDNSNKRLEEQKAIYQRDILSYQKQIEQLKREKLELASTIKQQRIQIERLLPASTFEEDQPVDDDNLEVDPPNIETTI